MASRICPACRNTGLAEPGVLWPIASNSDWSRQWIERCDTCAVYDSDEAAALAQVGAMIEAGTEILAVGLAVPVGMDNPQPYLEV